MKKEYIVVLLLVLILYFYSKKAKATPAPDGSISLEQQQPPTKSWDWKYYSVKAGDTLYKICKNNMNLDKIPSYLANIQKSFPSITTEKQFILYYTQCVAETNGFDWTLYDNKFSNVAKDPDSIFPKQKLTIFSPESYEVIDDKGPLFGGVQYVQGWELLPAENWVTMIRIANPQDLIDSFKNNPPTNI